MSDNKLFYAKKMIGKRVAVIKSPKNLDFYFGTVESAKDGCTLVVKNENDEKNDVSIFDIRNPNQIIL